MLTQKNHLLMIKQIIIIIIIIEINNKRNVQLEVEENDHFISYYK